MAQKPVDAKVAERCAAIVAYGCRQKEAARAAGIESPHKAPSGALAGPCRETHACERGASPAVRWSSWSSGREAQPSLT